MSPISAATFAGAAYALHVDRALTPKGAVNDVVVTIASGRIVAIEPALEYQPSPDRPVPTRLSGTAIVPGFLDVHHHIIEPFVKALTGGEPAQMWRRIWLPLEASSTPESVHAGATWTFLEALRGGITTIVDHGLRSREIAAAIHRAADETGIRLVASTGVYDLRNFSTTAKTPDLVTGIDEALAVCERHVADCRAFSRITPSIACGTVQSNSGPMIAALSGFCQKRGILFQIHANEHTLEVHASIEAYARRPIEYLYDLGALGRTTLIAHATLVTPGEIEMLHETDTAIAYNPVASMWKGNAVAPALQYITRGIRVGLGSDATRNDGFRMLDAAEAAQRIAYGMAQDDFSCGAGWRWVHAATAGGADVALLGDSVGQLAPGLKADFLLLDCSGPEVRPNWDFGWELVRFYDRADILATVVEGEAVMIRGSSTRFESAAFVDREEGPGVAAVHAAGLIRLHPTSDEAMRRLVP
jgi:5-methylthioadenosine/S-adenosylhomocysteine deaminase